jgi:hypothetical protein
MVPLCRMQELPPVSSVPETLSYYYRISAIRFYFHVANAE